MSEVFERLESFALPGDAGQILELAAPPEVPGKVETERALRVLFSLRKLWVSLTRPGDMVAALVGDSDAEETSTFWAVFGRLGMYYGQIAIGVAREDPLGLFWWMADPEQCPLPDPKHLKPDELQAKMKRVLRDSGASAPEKRQQLSVIKREMNQALAAALATPQILAFDRALMGLLLPHGLRVIEPKGEIYESRADAESFEGLKRLNGTIADSKGEAARTLSYLLEELLDYGRHLHAERLKVREEQGADNAFSDRWLEELVQLGKREEPLIAKYGKKRIEKRFERNITLLFQTFGFFTIPALPGEPAADLLCICRDDPVKFTLLIDAKSTKRPYSLPKSDQRALRDYVSETQRFLADLPPLKAAVLIGHGPAANVERKLQELEAATSLPCRFIDTATLTFLRERHNGPLPLDFFLEALLRSGSVFSKKEAEQLLERQSEIQDAFTDFVRRMRTAGSA